VGIVAVVELVPRAIDSNLNNRYDTTSTVVAQRMMDLMLTQNITTTTLADPTGTFPCGAGVVCNLGLPQDGVPVGARLINGVIDFSAPPVANYSFMWIDPNDPVGTQYDVRWNVVTSVKTVGTQPNVVVSKRFIVGVRSRGQRYPTSVTLTSWLSR